MNKNPPLSEKLRPSNWNDFQINIKTDKAFLIRLQNGEGIMPNLILWGPPGVGKTTFARLIGKTFKANFIQISAVMGGIKDIRDAVVSAKTFPGLTIVFIDEIHRFNKTQQDSLLPYIEDGSISLIGATTENPSFALTQPLLSRSRLVILEPLTESQLKSIAINAAALLKIKLDESVLNLLVNSTSGDARSMINTIELLFKEGSQLSVEEVEKILKNHGHLFYDRSGEEHYNNISAFIKSLRGSDPDAALFWGLRMIESGEDPRFIFRRLIIFASEDIGNADPRAIQIAVATSDAYERVGLPEGRIPLAQCITYLATAPKSNRSYIALNKALKVIKVNRRVNIPLHLRNAPTEMMRNLDYGKNYEYPHDQPDGVAKNVEYLPEEIKKIEDWYKPTDRGYEKIISERMSYWKKE